MNHKKQTTNKLEQVQQKLETIDLEQVSGGVAPAEEIYTRVEVRNQFDDDDFVL